MADQFEGAWPITNVTVQRDGTGRAVALLLSNSRALNLKLDRQL